MKKIVKSTQYKKDIKKYKHKEDVLTALYAVLEKLAKGEKLPKELYPHPLTGDYKDCMECHVGPDTLLIWLETDENGNEIVYLSRFGSHSELFKKKKKK